MFFVHTEKGATFLEGVRDLKLTKTEFEHASRANPMLFRSKEKSPQREVFAEMFAEKGLAAACRRSKTMKQRVLGVAGKMMAREKASYEVHWRNCNSEIERKN